MISNIDEELLEKNTQGMMSGGGQYFTPRADSGYCGCDGAEAPERP